MSTALIIVDVQNDFCEGGSMGVGGGIKVAQRVSEWLGTNRDRYARVFATMDWHPTSARVGHFAHFSEQPDFIDTWPAHCVAGTAGAALHSSLELADDTVLIRKGQRSAAYSGFEGSDASGGSLAALLNDAEIDAVDIVGLATDYCVKATALDAAALGFHVRVLRSMVAGVAPETTAAAIEEMSNAGVSFA